MLPISTREQLLTAAVGLLWWLSFRLVCFLSWGGYDVAGVLTSWLACLCRFVASSFRRVVV